MTSLDNNIITDFQIFYQKIYDIYGSDLDTNKKWTDIATYMNENNSIVKKIFSITKNIDIAKDILLDYESTISQLNDLIGLEADLMVKSSLIISALHNMVYDLLSQGENYYFMLNGTEEMAVLKKDIKYFINISIKPEQNIYFHAFILVYALESIFNKRFYVGIDYEYTNKKIQLAQLNFEHKQDLRGIIMVVSPNELEAIMMENFVKLIICNKNIKKILHGSDALDIPYMYLHMLDNDSPKIIKFTKSLIDTRFLCEYYKLNNIGEHDNRCSIYDIEQNSSAIFTLGLITEEQQKKLSELMDSISPDHVWNIHRLDRPQTQYAIYDVLFLKWFYYRIIYLATEKVESDLEKKATIEFYKKVIFELTQFTFLEKKNITYLLSKAKTEIDPINNYMVRKSNAILKLIDIYNDVSINITTGTPKTDIDKIMKVNYYKKPLSILLKRMTYAIISKKCRIYKDKNTIWDQKMDNQFIFEFLNTMEFYYLERMFREIEKILELRIKTICS